MSQDNEDLAARVERLEAWVEAVCGRWPGSDLRTSSANSTKRAASHEPTGDSGTVLSAQTLYHEGSHRSSYAGTRDNKGRPGKCGRRALDHTQVLRAAQPRPHRP